MEKIHKELLREGGKAAAKDREEYQISLGQERAHRVSQAHQAGGT